MQAQGQRIQASLTAQRSAAASPKPRGKNLYKKGYTVVGASFTALETEAALDIDHSAKLGRNIGVAYPNMVRPSATDAHHIVAREDYRAELARIYIYKVGIGINDADNGGIMPRFKTTFVPSMPNSSKHQEIHTSKYHASVYAELLYSSAHTNQEVRLTLRSIKAQLLAGTFPF